MQMHFLKKTAFVLGASKIAHIKFLGYVNCLVAEKNLLLIYFSFYADNFFHSSYYFELSSTYSIFVLSVQNLIQGNALMLNLKPKCNWKYTLIDNSKKNYNKT